MNDWRRWLGLAPAAAGARWLVLDTESSGLDPQCDRLLAIAALAVRPTPRQLLLLPGDSFEVVLRQDLLPGPPDKANILIHGIGVDAQRGGMEAAQALQAFERFAGASPLIGFHAAFDRTLISRHLRSSCGRRLRNPWLDLADLAPALCPGQTQAAALDDWLRLFGIAVTQRHQAAADAWATAELLQRLWPLAAAQGVGPGFAALARLAASRRWLGGG